MDEKHKNIIQTSFVYLTKNIHNVMQICDHLVSDEVLTYGMVDSIKYKSPAPTAQVRELLSILPRRGKKAYECFIEALSETENKDAADFLKNKEDPNYTPDSKKSKSTEDIQESTETHSGGGENSKKLNAPPDWPDLVKGIKLVQSKDIKKTTDEELEKIVRTGNVYNMTGSKKGKVIIISNVKCAPDSANNANCGCPGTETESKRSDMESQTNQENDIFKHCRDSVDFDKSNIQQLFKYMKFESPIPNKNITKEDMLKLLHENGTKDESYDSLVVVILSGGQSYDPMEIYDKNGEKVDRDRIFKIIKESTAFKGKPKVVIYRTYNFEGTDTNDKESTDTLDATTCNIQWPTVSNDQDFFVVTAVPRIKHGPWIVGDDMHGSYFIQALMHVFKEQAHNKPFSELLEEVNNCLHKAMVPNDKDRQKVTPKVVADVLVLEYCKNKTLYFFPKIENKVLPEGNAIVNEKKPVGASTCEKGKLEDSKPTDFFKWPDLLHGCSFKKKDFVKATPDQYETILKEGKQVYDMIKDTKKGMVIWISNIACPDKSKGNIEEKRITECRNNCDFDKTNMEQLLKAMGFECRPKDQLRDATGEEITQFVKKRLDEVDKDKTNKYASLLVMLMSGKVECRSDKIYDKDGKVVERSHLYDIFKKSQHFKEKPKIVIIQSYNFEKETLYDTTDGPRNEMIDAEGLNNDDLFVVSTYPRIEKGPWMVGTNLNGSYFIQAMIHVFKSHSHNKSFLELLQKVHQCLQTALVPELKDGKYEEGKPTRVADVVLQKYSEGKELFFFPALKKENVKLLNDFSSSVKGDPVTQPVDDTIKSTDEIAKDLQKSVSNCSEQNAAQTSEKTDSLPPDNQAATDTKSSLESPIVQISSESESKEQTFPQTYEKSNSVSQGDPAVTQLLVDTGAQLPKDTKLV